MLDHSKNISNELIECPHIAVIMYMKKRLTINKLPAAFSVPEAGLEPAQPVMVKGF